jgi:hypothetical protein
MAFNLDEYIENYVQDAEAFDRNVAQHLKEIIPNTTHLDENIFLEIIEDLKKEMDKGIDFKEAFKGTCEIYFLKGDVIKADLPNLLTRIILSKKMFISYIKKALKGAYTPREIENIFASGQKSLIMLLLGKLNLAKKNVVFATFEEKRKDGNPFLKNSVEEIIHRLALNRNVFKENESLSAVKIRYKNKENVEKRYPTFNDAGWNDKFYPAEIDDHYGRTKSLNPRLEGMPEMVHKNLKLADVVQDIEFLEDRNDKARGDR